jgi:hypothetical protein
VTEGVDYADSRPDPACLRRNGKVFAARYVGGRLSKRITKVEADRLLHAGIKIVTVWEGTAGEMARGRAAGVSAGLAARSQASAAGMPVNRPIYFALDVDPASLSRAQRDNCGAYLDGAATVIGRQNVGLYAGFSMIEALCPHTAPWGWQTVGWSQGRWSAKAHLQQYRIEVSMCGGIVDLDRATRADYGQWPYTATRGVVNDMAFMVAGPSGATLLVTGNAAVLVVSQQMVTNHSRAGIPLVHCDANQFSRYEKLRVDTAGVRQTEV